MSARQCGDVNADQLIVACKVKALLDQAFLFHARINAQSCHQIGGYGFQHTCTYTAKHIAAGLPLDDNAINPCLAK